MKKNKLPELNFLDKICSSKIAYLIILIFAVTAYSKSFSSGLVWFDDREIIQNLDKAGTGISPFESFRRDAFLDAKGDFYRPMQGFTLIVDYLVGGDSPKIYHVSNLIIHILTCMGLFYLLKTLGFDRGLSFLMTLLFTVHPLFNQAVAWVPGRGDLLTGLFGILSFIMIIKFFEGNSWLCLAAHLTAFSMAVFSKETAVLFPVIYALIYFFRYHGKDGRKFINLKNLTLLAGWILIVGFYLFMRSSVTNTKAALGPEEFGIPAFLSNLRAMPEFLAKFFIPVKLSGMPEFSVLISSIGISIMLGMVIFSAVRRKDFNCMSFIGIVWFVIFTAITMTYRNPHGNDAYDYLEHRTYLPSMGLIIFILSFAKDAWKTRLACCLIPLIFAYSVYSFANTGKFRDPLAFYNSVIDGGTNVTMAYYNRGFAKQNMGDKKGAIEDYLKTISIKGDKASTFYSADAYFNKAIIEGEMKEYETSIGDYTNAIKANPDFIEAYLNRGFIYGIMNRRADAIADYMQAIKINPQYPDAYNNLGVIYGTEGDYPESIKYFSKAIECNNKFADAYKNRGLSYLSLGDKRKACEDFKLSMENGSTYGKQLYEMNCR